MGQVFLDMSLSLDGYTAGPGVSSEQPMGRRGPRVQQWLFGDEAREPSDPDQRARADMFANTGAFILGRRTFDVGEASWGDDGTFGTPCFVVTRRGRDALERGPTTFHFVTDGIRSALEQAQAAAGDRDICVMGGAETARQYLDAGLLDELRIHLAPVVLGAGKRLFDHSGPTVPLETIQVVESPLATHLRFKVVKP